MTIKVVRGDPTVEELAAMVAVLSLAAAAGPAPVPRRAGTWASPGLLPRAPHTYGPAGWLASALPR
ncbi:acyl-CoA carboxylase subunit epsilon [Streptosporangium sp. G11]|uniref:acyl-CoA carboxylase subunit epsilon n=1 Tax=Streptosporangium sp. G11 TaxID=3436926 RepID=UPI003EB704D9